MSKHIAPARVFFIMLTGICFAVLVAAAPALAKENGSTITNNEIVRITTGTNNNLISDRINTLHGPRQRGGPSDQGGGEGSDQRSKVPGSKFFMAKEYWAANVLPEANYAASLHANNVDSPQQWTSYAAMALDTMAEQSKQAFFGEKRWGVWAMPSVSWLSSPSAASKFNGNLYSFMGGLDYKITERFLVGVGLGYEYLYLKTSFNRGNMSENGLTAMPYAAFMITDTTILDTSFGLTAAHYNTMRNDNITAKYDSTRTSWGTNLTQYFLLDKWTFSARVGNIYANEYRPTYWESDNRGPVSSGNTYLGEMQLGGNVSYSFDRFTPFISAAYLYDYALRSGDQMDRDELQGTLGLSFKAMDSLSLNLQLTNSFFRENINNTRLLLNMRYEF